MVVLSTDAHNLTGVHSFSAHGLAQPSVSVTRAGKTLRLSRVKGEVIALPAAPTKGNAAILAATTGGSAAKPAHFRPDQQRAALARFARLTSAAGAVAKSDKLKLGGRYQRAGRYSGKQYTFVGAKNAVSPRHIKPVVVA